MFCFSKRVILALNFSDYSSTSLRTCVTSSVLVAESDSIKKVAIARKLSEMEAVDDGTHSRACGFKGGDLSSEAGVPAVLSLSGGDACRCRLFGELLRFFPSEGVSRASGLK
jgi:hypothetical protein